MSLPNSKNKKRSLTEIREEVNQEGLRFQYKSLDARTPQELQLRVIFNMIYGLRYAMARNNEDKELADRQLAIFELAQSEALAEKQINAMLKTLTPN